MSRAKSRVSGVVVTGPLAGFTDAYRCEMRRRGYTRLAMVPQLRQVARLSRWMVSNGVEAPELNAERVEEFLAFQRVGGGNRSEWSRPGLLCMLEVLRTAGVAPAVQPPAAMSVADVLIAAFEGYLTTERGLAAGTIRGYRDHARRFVDGLPGGADVAAARAADVTEAVLRRSGTESVSATQNFVAGVRSFLRFCFVTGLMRTDLSQAAPAATGRRGSPLPRGIGRAEMKALLDCCDRRTALGRRDYAMIITLLRLGLRRAELAALTLGDIDWRAGEMLVHGKGGRVERLPLPWEVGEAIAGYLRRGPPAR